jgi:hypothetical protein
MLDEQKEQEQEIDESDCGNPDCPVCGPFQEEAQEEESPEKEQYGDRLDDSLFAFTRLVKLFRLFSKEQDFRRAIMQAPETILAAKVEEADVEGGVARLTLCLSRVKHELQVAEGQAISGGYAPDEDGNKAIGGGNESTRKAQEREVIRDDQACAELRHAIARAEDKLLEAKRAHQAAKDMRRYVESLRDGLMAVLRWKEAEK